MIAHRSGFLATACGTIAAAGLVCMLGAPARADFSPTGGSGETNFRTILDTLYNGGAATFVGADFGGVTYTSGIGIEARRVDDFGSPGGTLNVLTGYGNVSGSGTSSGLDQIWDDGIAAISGEAKFAAYSQAFGYTDSLGYHELFEVPEGNSGFFAPGSHSFNVDLTGATWTWDRSDANGDATAGLLHWSSDQSLVADGLSNDGKDHLITYEITGLGGPGSAWLLFWDDQYGGGDRDFNDLVVEVQAHPIPVPGAALLGALGLVVVGLGTRRWA